MYALLPDSVRLQTVRAYRLFRQNPSHPGLKFKKLEDSDDIYSVRIGRGYRALGQMDGQETSGSGLGHTASTISSFE